MRFMGPTLLYERWYNRQVGEDISTKLLLWSAIIPLTITVVGRYMWDHISNAAFCIRRKLNIWDGAIRLLGTAPTAEVTQRLDTVLGEAEGGSPSHMAVDVGRIARANLKFDRNTNRADPANRQLAQAECWALLKDPTVCPDLRKAHAVKLLPQAIAVCLLPSRSELVAAQIESSPEYVSREREVQRARYVRLPYPGFVGYLLAHIGIGQRVLALPSAPPGF